MPDQQSNLQIVIKTLKQGAGDKEAQQGLGSLKGELGDLSQGMLGVNLASIGLTAGLLALGKGALDLGYKAGEEQASFVRLDAVLKSTGGSAGVTMTELTNLSHEIMFLTGVTHEEVESAEAILLTFRNMSEEVFPRTIRAAADLSSVFGMDLRGSTMMLAKALSAPDEGLMALERATGKLSTAVKDDIKSLMDQGKTFEAQNLLLSEVEKRVGGAAAAMGNTYPGQVKKLNTAIGELGEKIGSALLPYLTKSTEALVLFFTWADKINLALSQQSENLEKTTKSFDEYKKGMIEAGHAAGKYTQEEADALNKSIPPRAQHYQVIEMDSKAEYENARATEEAAHATDALTESQAASILGVRDLNELVPELSQSIENYTDDLRFALGAAHEFGDYEENLAAAEKKLADDRKAGWRENSQVIKDDQRAIADIQKAHHDAILQMCADLYQYQLAADGNFSEDDMNKLLRYELAMGLLTQDEYDTAMEALKLKDMLEGLPEDVAIYVSTFYQAYGTLPDLNQPAGGVGGKGATGGGKTFITQTGFDFTVPPDFEGDNFPINLRAKSGERVTVQTPDQQHAEGGGGGGGNQISIGPIYQQSGLDIQALASFLVHL